MEAVAICQKVETFLAHPISQGAQGVHLCLDNLSVAQNARLVTQGSSQAVLKWFRKLAETWFEAGRRIRVQWISWTCWNFKEQDRRYRDKEICENISHDWCTNNTNARELYEKYSQPKERCLEERMGSRKQKRGC